jgi:hypothetical protein
MTFNEAIEHKKIYPTKIKYKDLDFTVCVTPYKQADFDSYKIGLREFKITDNVAKIFCSNGKYKVRGICFYRDINILYFTDLPIKE